MSISRGQMNRQLYGLGSYFPPENGREKFGWGSKLKRAVRKIIPNEVSKVAVKAAPFVAPFNPALAGAMAGIGGFDQTGRIGSSLKSGLFTYGGGQAARYLGGAGFQGNPFTSGGAFTPSGFMSGFSSPLGTSTGIGKLLADKGFIGTKTLPTDPGIATDSIFVQPGAEGTTYLPSDFATESIALEPGSVTSSGQIVSGTAAQNQAVLDQIAKQTVPGATENVVQKATERGYKDVFKDIFSGDLNKSTSAIKELGGKALKDIYTNPVRNAAGEIVDTQIDKLAIGATIAGAASYMEAKKLAEEAELVEEADQYTEEMYEADRARYNDYYEKILPDEAFGLKEGGRVKYAIGSPEPDSEMMRGDGKNVGIPSIMLDESTDQPEGIESMIEDKLSYYIPGFSSKDLSRLYRVLGKEGGKNVDFKNLHKVLSNPNDYPDAIIEIKQMLGIPETKKDGGRIGYAMGTEVPVRQNQGGITELDYRNTGGFVPIGVKEKADDVPAMLSKNEFVFTADAVRAAGGGSVNKGAQKMYNLMKSLENKVV